LFLSVFGGKNLNIYFGIPRIYSEPDFNRFIS
jgi:hypothetical protein